MEKYYSVNKTSEILDVSPLTVYRYIYSKRLKAAKMGQQWRIPESTIKELLENGWKPETKE